MKNLMQIASGVDVMPLVLALRQNAYLWNQNTDRTCVAGGAHSEVSDIWVRFRSRDELRGPENFSEPHESIWYPAYYKLPQARSIIFQLMARVEGERLGGVLITKIPPRGKVAEHSDFGWHANYYQKYAVQLESMEGQSFNFHGERLSSRPGDVYWFNNLEPHWVVNDSDFDRITMIVCIR